MPRKETSQNVFLADGRAVTVQIVDGLMPDDLIIQGAEAEAYRVMTGKDVFPTVDRRVKDFLVRIGVLS